MAKGIIGVILTMILMKTASEDRKRKKIPDSYSVSLALLGIAAAFVVPEAAFGECIAGSFAVSVPMFLITVMSPGAFGGGDIKLMAAAGILLGWKKTILAFGIAVFTGGMYALTRLIMRKDGRKAQIAFGPFLALSIGAAYWFGTEIIVWYCKIM